MLRLKNHLVLVTLLFLIVIPLTVWAEEPKIQPIQVEPLSQPPVQLQRPQMGLRVVSYDYQYIYDSILANCSPSFAEWARFIDDAIFLLVVETGISYYDGGGNGFGFNIPVVNNNSTTYVSYRSDNWHYYYHFLKAKILKRTKSDYLWNDPPNFTAGGILSHQFPIITRSASSSDYYVYINNASVRGYSRAGASGFKELNQMLLDLKNKLEKPDSKLEKKLLR